MAVVAFVFVREAESGFSLRRIVEDRLSQFAVGTRDDEIPLTRFTVRYLHGGRRPPAVGKRMASLLSYT